MQAQGYRIAENHRLVSMPPERVSEEWKSGGAGYWLDIQGSCHEALEHYLGELEIDPILLQLCEEDVEEIARVWHELRGDAGARAALCLPRCARRDGRHRLRYVAFLQAQRMV